MLPEGPIQTDLGTTTQATERRTERRVGAPEPALGPRNPAVDRSTGQFKSP